MEAGWYMAPAVPGPAVRWAVASFVGFLLAHAAVHAGSRRRLAGLSVAAARDWVARPPATLYALAVVPWAALLLVARLGGTPLNGGSPRWARAALESEEALHAFSLGFFAWDVLCVTVFYREPAPLIHGLAASLAPLHAFVPGGAGAVVRLIAPWGYVMELSTVFLHLRVYTKTFSPEWTRLRAGVNVLFGVTFIATRTLLFTAATAAGLAESCRGLLGADGQEGVLNHVLSVALGCTLTALNLYWTALILRKAGLFAPAKLKAA